MTSFGCTMVRVFSVGLLQPVCYCMLSSAGWSHSRASHVAVTSHVTCFYYNFKTLVTSVKFGMTQRRSAWRHAEMARINQERVPPKKSLFTMMFMSQFRHLLMSLYPNQVMHQCTSRRATNLLHVQAEPVARGCRIRIAVMIAEKPNLVFLLLSG